MNKLLLAMALATLPAAAGAHEMWIERDGTGPARIYLGEPAEPLPPGGDPEFAKLKAPRLLPPSSAAQVRKAGFIEVAVPPGDVRAWDDDVFTPWGPDGKKEGVVFYARAGRSEPRAAMPFEIAPTGAGAGRFVVTRDAAPIADAAVTVVMPDRSSLSLRSDAAGTIDVPVRGRGRYLLIAAHKDAGAQQITAGAVAVLHRITTTSFTVD